jgi:hypothetical protein
VPAKRILPDLLGVEPATEVAHGQHCNTPGLDPIDDPIAPSQQLGDGGGATRLTYTQDCPKLRIGCRRDPLMRAGRKARRTP